MYHVQKCNENSLLFFSLTLNNSNRWDSLRMLEFACCLPKLGTILVLFLLIMFEQTGLALENKMQSSAIASTNVFASVLFEPSRQKSAILKVPT